MKKSAVFVLVITCVVLLAGCTTTNLKTNKVGWSDYTTVTIKDFDVVGVITLESEVTKTVTPFGFSSTIEGSEITYAMLMEKAVEKKGDDIMNVRIDKHDDSKTTLFDRIIGYTKTTKYIATALVIRYKDVKAEAASSDFKHELSDASENTFSIPKVTDIFKFKFN
ncbi:MAG TPA: hypothetical protein PLG87_11280 [Treponemataceae bacterium]|nr:hypothetical protein [Treponemataceae bacterium]